MDRDSGADATDTTIRLSFHVRSPPAFRRSGRVARVPCERSLSRSFVLRAPRLQSLRYEGERHGAERHEYGVDPNRKRATRTVRETFSFTDRSEVVVERSRRRASSSRRGAKRSAVVSSKQRVSSEYGVHSRRNLPHGLRSQRAGVLSRRRARSRGKNAEQAFGAARK